MDIWSYVRRLARCAWVQVLAWSGCLRWAETALSERGAVLVLTLHRVLNDSAYEATNSLPGIMIRERTFAELVRYVTERYEPVFLDEAAPRVTSSTLRVAITFDDGWRDNYTNAFPIARTYNLPMTVFVCPALTARREAFWPERAVALLRAKRPVVGMTEILHAIGELKTFSQEKRDAWFANRETEVKTEEFTVSSFEGDRTLGWNEISAMQQAGVRFGSHTKTHQILTTIPATAVCKELADSKLELEQTLGMPCRVFAYPNGNSSPETRELVKRAGFIKAVTTEPGAWMPSSDPLAVPRLNVSEDNVAGLSGDFWPAMFRYTVVWKAWRATRRTAARHLSFREASATRNLLFARGERKADSSSLRSSE